MKARLKRLLRAQFRISGSLIALAVILLVALDLRVQSVLNTVVAEPLRTDAGEYVLYAFNLKNFGVYSRSDTWPDGVTVKTPVPDAVRVPGYALYLALFLGKTPTVDEMNAALVVQALLSVATVFLAWLLARRVLPDPFALAATALVAISPHLVTMNVYVLSESIFCFTLVLALWALTRLTETKNPYYVAAAGASLGVAALTHPMALYFIVPLAAFLIYHFGRRAGIRKATLIVVGFAAVCTPWVARNLITLGAPGDNTLMYAALRAGAYRDMTYKDNTPFRGFPYMSDPGYLESIKSLGAVTQAIGKEFEEAPAAELRWYLLEKPVLLWSWDIVAGEGDVFVYMPISTPYRYLPQFKLTHALMRLLHEPLVVLMLIGAILAWLPPKRSGIPKNGVFAARVISLLLFYHAAIMTIGFPEPRYAIPMRPFMYILALAPLPLALNYLRSKTKVARSRKP